MYPSITIRPYQKSDKNALIELLKQNVPTYFAESEIEDFRTYLEHQLEQYFVAEIDQTIVGAGGINFDIPQNIAKISWDFIATDFHGKGIGKKLLEYRLTYIKSLSHIHLISVRTSQLAYLFYQKNGFILKEVIKDYWAEGFDLYWMEYKEHTQE